MRNATLRQLRALAALARTGSVTRAAELLHLTPPAVTLQLQALQHEAGMPLIDRGPAGMRLTDAGREVAAAAKRIDAVLGECEAVLGDLAGFRRGAVGAGITSTAKYFAPRALGAFTRRHPGLELRLAVGNRAETIAGLREAGQLVSIASGDQPRSVVRVAASLGLSDYAASQTPVQKASAIAALRARGRRVLMVGDGLNDSPSLAAALVSAAPCSAADISQTVADVVYFGNSLSPVGEVLRMARRARRTMGQNLALSFAYNAVMLPLAACGYVNPWVAALAMSSSSVLVITNALRLQGSRL